ncbi:hypothetical protein [Methylobacterium ajmalii]
MTEHKPLTKKERKELDRLQRMRMGSRSMEQVRRLIQLAARHMATRTQA